VGLNHVVLESGFTYNTSGGYFNRYSFPETLVRIGMFYDWLEFRVAQNVSGESLPNPPGQKSTLFGADDLQLGVKLALTEQKEWMPESALVLQMTVPSGSPGFSANRVLPGLHYNASWEIIKEKLSVETILFADGTVDDFGHTYTLLGHGVTAVYDLTKKLEAFGEIDSYYSLGESAGPQHYFVGGLVYFITRNMEIDIRSGVGLNQHASGYLLGTGFSVRY
jgi:Putative MetA-pathway of phenol degradation